jgi:SAM-dependent methyltransferase
MQRRKRVKWITSSKDNAELKARYDRWAATYDDDLHEAFGWIGPQRAADVLCRLVSSSSRVLDAGAGTGLVGQELAARGYTDLVAADISDEMLEQARAKDVYSEFYRVVLGEPLVFETDSFDAVISVGVLTLGHAPASSLDELVRITAAGGHIVFTLRPELHTAGGFRQKQRAIEQQGRWVLAEVSEPFYPMPAGEPDVTHQVWAYRVL